MSCFLLLVLLDFIQIHKIVCVCVYNMEVRAKLASGVKGTSRCRERGEEGRKGGIYSVYNLYLYKNFNRYILKIEIYFSKL